MIVCSENVAACPVSCPIFVCSCSRICLAAAARLSGGWIPFTACNAFIDAAISRTIWSRTWSLRISPTCSVSAAAATAFSISALSSSRSWISFSRPCDVALARSAV